MTTTIDRCDPDAVGAWKAERVANYRRLDELEAAATCRPLTADELSEHRRLRAAVEVSLCAWLNARV